MHLRPEPLNKQKKNTKQNKTDRPFWPGKHIPQADTKHVIIL